MSHDGAGAGHEPTLSTEHEGSPVVADPASTQLEPGTELASRWRILGLAGRGGMGEVYRAEDLKLQTEVALKLVVADAESPVLIARLVNEVRLARQVHHPNVCRVYDLGESAGRHFLTMELVDGEDLAALLRRVGRLPREKALEVGRELCAGLAAIHDCGILHRDLKPANVMLDGGGRVRLTDFGLAARAGSVHGAAVRHGTPSYMAPELGAGATVTTACDVYALGLILCELLTGQRDLERPRRPGQDPLGAPLRELLRRCLDPDPARRPVSAREVAMALRDCDEPGLYTVLIGELAEAPDPAAIERGEADAIATAARHERLVHELAQRHAGSPIETPHGAVLLFDRPNDAVRYALALQRGSAEMASGRRAPRGARIGIHLGEVVLRRKAPEAAAHAGAPFDVEGRSPAIARALARLAGAGQTLLTRAVFDVARQSQDDAQQLEWLAHGEYAFQGLAEPFEVCEVGAKDEPRGDAPESTAEATRLPGEGIVLGWRPAPGLSLPERPFWVMEKSLGEGGFGEVWLARHLKTLERRVFKFCFDLSRLRALEREITLFRLLKEELGERADIVRILDWNFANAPYFIESEHTAGGDLREWAEARGGLLQVPLGLRLELVAQVAEALAAAHSVGVLHKDVKPQNVLVHEAGGRVQARLADFGIALLADVARLEKAGITVLGMTVGQAAGSSGTPLYRAPELIEGKAATIQADVYALGVMLYQVVVGDFSRALAPGWQREVDDEILREDIARAVEGLPGRRLGDAAQLAVLLRTVDARRLERAAAERAEARQARWRRLRRLAAAAGALILTFAGMTWHQSRRVAREAERANREAESVRAVADFMTGLFADTDPLREGQNVREVTAQQLLDRGAERLGTELRDRPAIRAEVLHTIGGVYRSLGLYERAEPLLRESLRLRESTLGSEHPEVAESLIALGWLLQDLGRFTEAEPLVRRALTIDEASFGADQPKVAEDLDHLAGLLRATGRAEQAEGLYRRALAINEGRLGPAHPEVAMNVNNLALVLTSLGRAEQAVPLYARAIAILETQKAARHPELASVLNNLAGTYMTMGRRDDAEPLFRRALAIREATYGPDHPAVAVASENLASLLRDVGKLEEAEALFRRALAIRERSLGPEHPKVAVALSNLAGVLTSLGRLAEAEPLYERALALKRASPGAQDPSFARTLFHQGRLFELEGRRGQAESNYRRALAILEAGAPDHPWTREARAALAALVGPRS